MKKLSSKSAPRRIAFVRTRLGLGGSERLVVDAAVELQRRGHEVRVFAPDPAGIRQFAEVSNKTISVDASGGWLPTQILGRARVPCALLRAAFAALRAVRKFQPDLIFVDVMAHVIPLIRRISNAPVIFYCHFPDALLTADGARAGKAYAAYRRPWDALERRGLTMADFVLVNSQFTKETLEEAFSIQGAEILRPAVKLGEAATRDPAEFIFLSVARFDPRKNLELAVRAIGKLFTLLGESQARRVQLILAGHYDHALAESQKLVATLRREATCLRYPDAVKFIFSPSDAELDVLKRRAFAFVYTPKEEHFGYVPLEAMALARPVIAINRGGPKETVVDQVTGYLVEPVEADFAEAMARLILDPARAAEMGRSGYAHVRSNFSTARFGAELEAIILKLLIP